jgi:adenylate cyclase
MADPGWEKLLTEGHRPLAISRRMFRAVPSNPRCKVCSNPFGGMGGRMFRMAGFRPSPKNPNLCTRCCDNLAPGGAEVDVAILFADVRGSTTLGEGMAASEFAQVLGRFYDVATDVLLRHDAVVDKLIGDEVMALFLPGIAGPGYRARAVQAAVELLRGVGYGTSDGPWLEVGVGVNAGVAFVGNVGREGMMDFTALGDPVNLAARLQQFATPEQVYFSESTWHAMIRSEVPHEEAGTFELKNIGPTRAYRTKPPA